MIKTKTLFRSLRGTEAGKVLLGALIAIGGIALVVAGVAYTQPVGPANRLPPATMNVAPGTIIKKPVLATGLELMVRGYTAATVGRSGSAEKSGLYLRTIAPKDIYLPGVTVYLEDPQNGKTSKSVQTDLSGRFTLFAPDKGAYRICWKSSVYGTGCQSNLVSTGSAPQFVSAVRITIPRKQGFVAAMGHVTTADGSLTRTYEPLMNINAFAMVSLIDAKGVLLAAAYVNNFGDYLLPYLPVKQNIKLVATIESAKLTQEISTDAKIERAQLHKINLKLTNKKPVLDPLLAFDTANNRRVQNAAPGSEIMVKANARDGNGDPIKFVWFLDEAEGKLSQNVGNNVKWKLPGMPGRYTVTVVAYDGNGGYDKASLSVLADGQGVPFSGVVVDPSGAPIDRAEIEIVDNPVPIRTDSKGRFYARVKEAARYVLNVRKDGFALNSQIYDRGITGGRWILRPAQVVTIDPTQNVRVMHKRGERDCPGPGSMHASLGAAGDSLKIPQWQDGQGNVIDAPQWWSGPRPTVKQGAVKSKNKAKNIRVAQGERQPVVLPQSLKLPKCGPGVAVEIPANSIVDAHNNPVTTLIKVAISTVDVLSPQQMPGDESVVPSGGGGGYIESFGAGAFDLPAGMKLKSGTSAKVTIAVDRSRLVGGGALPATVPLLSYNEKKGLWIEEGTLTLTTVAGVQSYVGQAKHFSPFNADNVKNATSACLRVFSPTLPASFDLEVSAPLGGTGAPKVLTKNVTNVSPFENVIYNLPSNTNITLAPMTTGATPQLLGYYIVNSGQPQNPNNSPNIPTQADGVSAGPPYDSCQNFVVLTVSSAPPSSPMGGEFLHGLGYIDALNLGFNDLTSAAPTGNALVDAIVTASKNYYNAVDPGASAVDTLDKFKTKYGFGPLGTPAVGEIVASYANSGDLGFGRDMHCINKLGDIACYVTNYGSGYNNVPLGGGTSDQDDADAAAARADVNLSKEVATVAMEYAQINGVGPRVVKFFVYKKNLANYGRSISANLDGRGERPVPQLCMICHGGQAPNQTSGIAFNNAADVNLNSRFLPFDHRLFTFPGASPKAGQEAAMKSLNKDIVDLVPTGAAATDPIREVIKALYDDGTPGGAAAQLLTTDPNQAVTGWKAGASANVAGQTNFYTKVVANACRTCHISQPFAQLQFNNSDKFINLAAAPLVGNKLMLGTAQSRVCGDYAMPHALRTHEIFWGTFTSIDPAIAAISMPSEFQTFGTAAAGANAQGTWSPSLCTAFISPTVSTPSKFYQQSIQPIFNGKCVVCHISGNGFGAPFSLTEGNSFPALVTGGRVTPGDDVNSTLILRTTAASPGSRMPPNCFRAPAEQPNGNLPCLPQTDIDKIKVWIRSGAN